MYIIFIEVDDISFIEKLLFIFEVSCYSLPFGSGCYLKTYFYF